MAEVSAEAGFLRSYFVNLRGVGFGRGLGFCFFWNGRVEYNIFLPTFESLFRHDLIRIFTTNLTVSHPISLLLATRYFQSR